MRKFEIFFDIIDNYTCVHMYIKKKFQNFSFSGQIFEFPRRSTHRIFSKQVFFNYHAQPIQIPYSFRVGFDFWVRPTSQGTVGNQEKPRTTIKENLWESRGTQGNLGNSGELQGTLDIQGNSAQESQGNLRECLSNLQTINKQLKS